MTQDIILVTIDALRHDMVDHMPNVTEAFSDGIQTDAVTAGAATNWVFPAILSGSYYTKTYDDSGLVRDDVRSLPDLLGENEYSTGAFLAFNPYLNKWRNRFDEFWNGGLSGTDEEWHTNSVMKWLNRGYRTALLRKRVSATEVLDRAERWYDQQSGPRFLWVHLMEPHKPYYPGLRRGADVGLIRSYSSIIEYQRHGDDTAQRHMDVQHRLYRQCVERMDSELPRLFEFIDDDAAVIVTGDHGDEFDHGHYGHERLYDECVRVPFFSKNLPADQGTDPVRQIDIPGTLLSVADQPVPDEWNGDRLTAGRTAYMMTPRPSTETFQCAVRTPDRKLIKTFDRNTGENVRNECYQLETDPQERANEYGSVDVSELETELDRFMREHKHALSMDLQTGSSSDAVNERLKNLGYK
ncbi:sulfatase-like hydrolase/transferase [Halorubrum lipolyticum]|uniref:sulfatase-like hydrolase/transferase n=1 Tax=Halorubrum lipolyticum TaxID=368624 RepID=UPI0009E5BD9B|nr:sulfatase-like hydrolase/transferase [Halorubrum lipolyticum]